MAMALRMHAGGSILAGAQRLSARGRITPRRPLHMGTTHQESSKRIVFVGMGAAASVATATAVVFATIEGDSDATLRPLVSSCGESWSPLGLGRVVHADAMPALADDGATVGQAEEEIPEFIKQADAKVCTVPT